MEGSSSRWADCVERSAGDAPNAIPQSWRGPGLTGLPVLQSLSVVAAPTATTFTVSSVSRVRGATLWTPRWGENRRGTRGKVAFCTCLPYGLEPRAGEGRPHGGNAVPTELTHTRFLSGLQANPTCNRWPACSRAPGESSS